MTIQGRTRRPGLTRLWALLGVVALLGFTVSAPAYAAKPSGTSDGATTTSASSGSTTTPGKSDHSKGNASTTGDPGKPQPYSGADNNNTGANDTSDTNQYRSTRHGEPSLNGNEKGNATGKPAAGSVGKADNKNPPGQYPNGTDHNNGYECDGNNGIAKENPAHTGCQPQADVCVDNPDTTVNECQTTPPCVPTTSTPCTPPCVPTTSTPCTPPCVPTTSTPCTPPCVPTTSTPCTPPCVPTTSTPCTPATECVDNPDTTVNECQTTPPCITTATNPCTPPTVCVDNPQTTVNECDTTNPPVCLAGNPFDNPATAAVECSLVSPPGGPEGGPPTTTTVSPPTGTTSASSPSSSVLPQTGAPAGALWTSLLGLLLLGGGALVATRIRGRVTA